MTLRVVFTVVTTSGQIYDIGQNLRKLRSVEGRATSTVYENPGAVTGLLTSEEPLPDFQGGRLEIEAGLGGRFVSIWNGTITSVKEQDPETSGERTYEIVAFDEVSKLYSADQIFDPTVEVNRVAIEELQIDASAPDPRGMVVTDRALYIVDDSGKRVVFWLIDAASGRAAPEGTFDLAPANGDPVGLASDGDSLFWVADKDGIAYCYSAVDRFERVPSLDIGLPRGAAEGTIGWLFAGLIQNQPAQLLFVDREPGTAGVYRQGGQRILTTDDETIGDRGKITSVVSSFQGIDLLATGHPKTSTNPAPTPPSFIRYGTGGGGFWSRARDLDYVLDDSVDAFEALGRVYVPVKDDASSGSGVWLEAYNRNTLDREPTKDVSLSNTRGLLLGRDVGVVGSENAIYYAANYTRTSTRFGGYSLPDGSVVSSIPPRPAGSVDPPAPDPDPDPDPDVPESEMSISVSVNASATGDTTGSVAFTVTAASSNNWQVSLSLSGGSGALTTSSFRGTGTASRSTTITGLSPGTAYTVTAIALDRVNLSSDVGTGSFTTTSPQLPPSVQVSTYSASATGDTTAGFSGTVSNAGGGTVSLVTSVTIFYRPSAVSAAQTITVTTNAAGAFSGTISGLSPGTAYTTRARAQGIGVVSTFTTTGESVVPTPIPTPTPTSTLAVNLFAARSSSNPNAGSVSGTVSVGGTVTRPSTVTLSVSPTGTFSDSTPSVASNGSFSATLSNLSPATSYVVTVSVTSTDADGTSYTATDTASFTTIASAAGAVLGVSAVAGTTSAQASARVSGSTATRVYFAYQTPGGTRITSGSVVSVPTRTSHSATRRIVGLRPATAYTIFASTTPGFTSNVVSTTITTDELVVTEVLGIRSNEAVPTMTVSVTTSGATSTTVVTLQYSRSGQVRPLTLTATPVNNVATFSVPSCAPTTYSFVASIGTSSQSLSVTTVLPLAEEIETATETLNDLTAYRDNIVAKINADNSLLNAATNALTVLNASTPVAESIRSRIRTLVAALGTSSNAAATLPTTAAAAGVDPVVVNIYRREVGYLAAALNLFRIYLNVITDNDNVERYPDVVDEVDDIIMHSREEGKILRTGILENAEEAVRLAEQLVSELQNQQDSFKC